MVVAAGVALAGELWTFKRGRRILSEGVLGPGVATVEARDIPEVGAEVLETGMA